MTLMFTDDDVASGVTAPMAVEAMREAVRAERRGALVAPPRIAADLGGGRVVITAGALDGEWFGFRSYDTFGLPAGEQVVVLHDARTGKVRAVAVGEELGARRTGAIGGVAVDALARPDAATLGMVGTGQQAWTQLWAAAAVRALREVTVYSRTAGRRVEFAARIERELGIPARVAASAAEAVGGRDIVVLATTSPTPVFEAGSLAPGTHVNAVGFKQRGRAEFGLDLAERAAAVVTDSVAQVNAYQPPMLLAGTRHADRVVALGAVLSGDAPGRRGLDEVTMFCSVGLAGTEVFLLDRLAAGGGAKN